MHFLRVIQTIYDGVSATEKNDTYDDTPWSLY